VEAKVEAKPVKRVIKKVVKKNKDDSINNKNEPVVVNITTTTTNGKINVKIDNIVIPDNYDYRVERKLKDDMAKLLKIKTSKSHIEIRRLYIDYITTNNLLEGDMIKNENIKFCDIDKLIFNSFQN
jgi:hypothetical protein